MTRPLKPQFEAADPGEQTCNQHDVELSPRRKAFAPSTMLGPQG